MVMILTANVSGDATGLPVDAPPPAWLTWPCWATPATASPAPRELPFEVIRILGYADGALTVERGRYLLLYDPTTLFSPASNDTHLGSAAHSAGTEVALGLPLEHLSVTGGQPYSVWANAKVENARLARQQRRYRETP